MKLYNTLSKTLEEFSSINEGVVSLYTCGPTVYNYAHIGNLRTYIFEDILKRVLNWQGYKINHVMNITDVGHLTSDSDTGDDKMEKGAVREGKTVWDIANFYTKAFQLDFHELNCIDPDTWSKATDHIQEQIDLIKRLEEKGFTYKIEDGIYFDTSKFPRYADFAKLNLEQMKAGARVAITEGKKNASDFALWKSSPTNSKRAMEWESPWGTGFPGWHIECSAMSMKYLGETFDIHCGGIDHVPVHHTNEVAQAEAATGKKFVNYWIHGEFLIMGKDKMAKSGNNFVTIAVLKEKGFSPLDYRYFCFSAHYRSPLSFSWEGIEAAHNTLRGLKERVQSFVEEGDVTITPKAQKAIDKFSADIADDMNMPNALATLWTTIRDNTLGPSEKLAFIQKADSILGLDLCKKEESSLDANVEKLIEERNIARKEKNFARSDEIRDTLLENGIILEDTPNGIRWKKK